MNKRGMYWVLSLFAIPLAYAQEESQVLTNIWGWIRTVSFASENSDAVAKLLLGVIIFTLIYYGLTKIFKGENGQGPNNRINVPVAISMTLGALYGIPTAFAVNLFKLYGGAFALLFTLAIPVAVYFVGRQFIDEHTHPRAYHILQFVLNLIALTAVWFAKDQLKTFFPTFNFNLFGSNLSGWLAALMIIIAIIMIYHLIQIIATMSDIPRPHIPWPRPPQPQPGANLSVDFTFTPNTAGQPTLFVARAGNGTAPYNYVWDFGDGGTDVGERVQHAYAAPGNYNVTVTATDGAGANATATHPVTINIPPRPPPPRLVGVIRLGPRGQPWVNLRWRIP